MGIDAGVRNVDELRIFARNLQDLGEKMTSLMMQAQRKMNEVSEGWQDRKTEEFKVRFDESVRQIQRMSDDFREYNAYITRLGNKVDEYKGIR